MSAFISGTAEINRSAITAPKVLLSVNTKRRTFLRRTPRFSRARRRIRSSVVTTSQPCSPANAIQTTSSVPRGKCVECSSYFSPAASRPARSALFRQWFSSMKMVNGKSSGNWLDSFPADGFFDLGLRYAIFFGKRTDRLAGAVETRRYQCSADPCSSNDRLAKRNPRIH